MVPLKIALGLYLVLSGGIAFWIWKNSSASDSLQNVGILFAGLLPALVAVLPYLVLKEEQRSYSLVLFFDESQRKPVLTNIFDPYTRAYSIAFANLSDGALSSREIEDSEVETGFAKEYWTFYKNERGLDLVERAVLLKLLRKFLNHWDVEFSQQNTPTGISHTGKVNQQSGTQVRWTELAKEFQHNKIIRDHPFSVAIPQLTIPPGGKITTKVTGKNSFEVRHLEIETKSGQLKITMRPSGGSVATGGVWGLVAPSEHLKVLVYQVTVKMRFRRGINTPNTDRHRRWFENISSSIAELDWATIDQEVERSLLRNLLAKSQQ